MTSDVSLPTQNPLHSLPSLNHQSSTQSQLDHTNVNYNDFDNEYPAQESMEDQPNQDLVIEQCTFQRNTVRLPPDIAFQVHTRNCDELPESPHRAPRKLPESIQFMNKLFQFGILCQINC